MKKIVIILTLLPALVFCGELDDLRKMNKAYLEANSFSMKISIASYRNEKDSKALFTFTGEVKKIKSAYFTEMNGRTSLNNEEYSLLVDEHNKVIVISKAARQRKENKISELIMNDSLFSAGFSYKFILNTADKKVIEVTATEPALWENKKMVITLNAKNFTLQEIVVYPKTNKDEEEENSFEKMVIRYDNVELNKVIPGSDFSEKKYVDIKKKNITATGKYAQYKVIDQLKKS
ncbi:MAG: hypothetical protein IAF38_13375 [Bacteroidia bacterium]|nr:hypothetical protein [Bacteroidia bacterium]